MKFYNNKKFRNKSNAVLKNLPFLEKIKKEFLTEEKILKRGLDDAQLYFDFADTMLIVLGKDQRVLKINKKGCEILGYPVNKIIGKKYFDNFIPARFRKEMKSFFQDLVSGKKILRRYFENPVLTARGERLIAWRNVVLKNPDGTIAGTLSEGRDITDQREAENRIIESEKRFRLFFENAPAGYIVCFLDGKIYDVNQFFISMTGFRKEQVTGKNFKRFVFSKDKKTVDQLFNSLKTVTVLSISEFRIIKKDGSPIDVYCAAKLAGKEEKMIQIILYDITHCRVIDKLNEAQEKIGSVLNEALDSSEIASKVAAAIKKSFGFEIVAIYFKDDRKKQPFAKGFQNYIQDCFAGRTKKESKGLISKTRIDGKEKYFSCFLLKTKDEIFGVLFCADISESKFSPETVSFLKNAAKLISVGLQRIKSFNQLQATIRNFETFIGSTKDMAFIKDSKFRYIYVNPEYSKFFKKSVREIIGKSDFDLMEPRTAGQCRRTDKQSLKEDRLVINEEFAGNRTYETRKFPVKLETGEIGVGAFIRDITEEKESKQKLSNLMWMYTILYQVNQAIVRAKNAANLLKEICKIACDEGKFILAWICMVDYEKKSVVPVAGYGKTQYYKDIKISLDPQSFEGKGPTARAIRTERVCVCNDILSDKRMQPWRKQAIKYGFCSSAAVPIKSSGKVIGALNLYSDQRNFFSEEIKKLIVEISFDIGLCIEKMNAEEIRKKAEQRLRENEQHLAEIFENLPVPALEMDLSEVKNSLDSIKERGENLRVYIAENSQYLKDTIKFLNINRKMFELFSSRDTGELIELLKENLATPEIIEPFYTAYKIEQFQTKIKTSGGIEKDVILNFNTLSGNESDWSRLIVSIVDITDRVYMEKNIRATLSRFRGFFDTTSAGIGILTLEGRPVALNQRVCEMLGYSHEELMKMKLADVVHPEDLPSVKSTFEKLRNGEITRYETERRYIRKDGAILYARASGELVFDEILNKQCIIAIVIDITELKKYLERIKRISNALQAAVACNEIFTKAEDEKAMLSSVCNEISKVYSGFVFVILKNISGIEIAAYSKENFEFFSELREMYLEKSQRCPISESLFEKKIVILNDIESSDYPDGWRHIVKKYGYKSIFAMPIIDEGVSIGCLSIFSPAKNRFIESEEQSIVNGIVENIGYCVTVFKARKERNASVSELQKSYARLQNTIEGISLSIARIIETRDPYTAGHQARVAKLAVAIAAELGVPENIIRSIHFAGILHDIGKVNVPVEILVKPGKITDDEFSIIKLHSITGYDILSRIPFPWDIARIVRQHHERLNGSGYPDGLTEKDILLEARIIAVADVVEAMAFDRPYRTAFGIDFALSEIKQKSGILFDPSIVDICVSLFKEKGFVFD